MPREVQKIIEIKSSINARTGLMAAFSDDLPGLLVIGKTIQELEEKLPGALREILEAQGNTVTRLELIEPVNESRWDGFPKFRAEANLNQAA